MVSGCARLTAGLPSRVVVRGVLVVALLLLPGVGQADDRAQLGMLGSRASKYQDEVTLATVRAHLFDAEAAVEPMWLDTLPSRDEALLLAAEFCSTRALTAVFWQSERQLHIYIPGRTPDVLLVRELGVADEASTAHSIGLIVSNTLASMLSGAPPESSEVSPTSLSGDPPESLEVSPTSESSNGMSKQPKARDPIDEGASSFPKKEDRARKDSTSESENSAVPASLAAPLPARLLVLMAYNLESESTEAPAIHGGRLGINVRLFQSLYVTLDYTISMAVEQHTDKIGSLRGTLELRHHPIDLGLRWLFSLGRRRLGFGVAFSIDIVNETEKPGSKDPRTVVRYNIVPEVTGAVRIVGPLFATLHLGVRILTEKPHYRVSLGSEDTFFYDPWRFQPRVSAGLYVALF